MQALPFPSIEEIGRAASGNVLAMIAPKTNIAKIGAQNESTDKANRKSGFLERR